MFRLLQGHRPGRVCRGFAGQPTLSKMCVCACVCNAWNMNYVIYRLVLFKAYIIVQVGKLYVVKHNCVIWGVFNDYIMDNYMFRPVLAIFRLSWGNLISYYKHARAPEDGQYRPKHVVVHYIVIKYTSCETVVFDYIQFSKFHTHTTGMTHFLDRAGIEDAA